MTQPAFKVEVAFVANPYGTLTWTDVTSYVEEVDTGRGRNDELNQTDAGTATVALNNTDGRFDPTNTASPYYPNVLPFRPLRITAVYSATTYNIWYGFVERWPQTWTMNGTYGVVTVTAVDAMKVVLAKDYGLRYFEEVESDAPTQYFRLSDTIAAGSLSYVDTMASGFKFSTSATTPAYLNLLTGLIAGSPDAGRTVAAPFANNGAHGAPIYANSSNASVDKAYTGDFAVEMWVKTSTVPTDGTHVDYLNGNTTFPPTGTDKCFIRAQFGAGGASYQCSVLVGGVVTPMTLSTAVIPTAGRADHIVVTRSLASVQFYANGVLLGVLNGTSGNTVWWGGGAATGFLTIGYLATAVSPVTITVDEVAFYAANLSQARIIRHYQAGSLPQEFVSQDSGARVSAVLDAVNWPTAMRVIDTGQSTLQASGSLSGTSALTVIRAAADDELGVVFIDGQGRVVFQNRAHRNSAASAATLGEGAGEFPYQSDIQIDFDDTYVYNDVQITMAGSSPTSISESLDTTSQTTYGLRVYQRTAQLSNVVDCIGQANTLLARYKDPHARITQISLEGRSHLTNFPQMLGREIGDLVTVKRRPIGGAVITLACFIDGIQHKITSQAWTTTFLLTPQWSNATY